MNRIEGEALVVRAVNVGESDVIATLITEQVGKVSAIARGARKGSGRLGGAIEALHTIAVLLEDKGAELTVLKEARIVRARPQIATNLEAFEAAGVALRWARHSFPPRTREPQGWHVLVELLDALEGGVADCRIELARAGLAMLAAVGYAIELERCVVCGRKCPTARAACVDPARGGLVCRSCGGASTVLSPQTRLAAQNLMARPRTESDLPAAQGPPVTRTQAEAILALVDRAMGAHAGFER